MKKIVSLLLVVIFLIIPCFGYVYAAENLKSSGKEVCTSLETAERKESVLISDPNDKASAVTAVHADNDRLVPEIKTFSELTGKTVSMLNGAPFEELVKSKNPHVGEFTYYSNMSDILLAIKNRKTDAILSNNAISQLSVNRNPDLMFFPESLKDGVFGLAFPKGDPARDKWQAAFDRIPESTITEAWEKWTGSDEDAKILPAQDWPGNNGTITAAVCDTLEPMSYAGQDGKLMGFDVEIILLMAKELDMHVDLVGMEFSSVLSYVQSGKALIGAGSIIVTDERKEAVDFVEYYPAAFVLIVRAKNAVKNDSFLVKLEDSFNKTFIREGRWKMFIKGALVTLLITFASICCGTFLGFFIYMLCRRGNRAANAITKTCLWLIHGMPEVVLLMILFYIVFGSFSISGVAVAIIGFTLVFGASMIDMLRNGVNTVDNGQYEAAYALGYSDLKTFFIIILPQAMSHILPNYKGAVISLIKGTAIVGYIAVQDLTKVGDLIRSRTYEAFFPLIAITVIYFLLEGMFRFLLSLLEKEFDPKRRSKEKILKGVRM